MSQTQHILAFDVLRLYLSLGGNALSIDATSTCATRNLYSSGNDSNLLIVFYVQIMPDDFVMQLHRF